MSFAPENLEALRTAPFDTIIDVRSPSEFAEDHVPGAINLPVLDDDERARVGTIYTQRSAFMARKIGSAIVARNAAAHIEGPLSGYDGSWRPLVYCWRGGQRSNSFASILSQIGWRVEVLDGGYRSYRSLVKRHLYDVPFDNPVVLLDGFTGTAKTELLHLVAERGGQILDLEGMANHRGSLFGAMGAQPSQKMFETDLATAVRQLDPTRPVLIEAESSKVGDRIVPPSLWSAMRAAPRIEVAATPKARADYLVRTYADIVADPSRLDSILTSLRRLQGHERVNEWRVMASEGQFAPLAEALMIHHYDPRYARQRGREARPIWTRLETDTLDPHALEDLADQIVTSLQRDQVNRI